MKRIDYLKPNDAFFEAVKNALGGNAFNNMQGFEDRENSVIIKLGHYNGAGHKLIEVDKVDVEKYFALHFENEETIKI